MIESLRLETLDGEWTIARLAADDAVPSWAWCNLFSSVSRTSEGLSIIAPSGQVPGDVKCERGFRVLVVGGPLSFDAKGILADLTGAVAEADVALLALSNFDTDILLVRQEDLEAATAALLSRGHEVVGQQPR